MNNEVSDSDVQLVSDGFKTFIKGVEATQHFVVDEFKNFMEPIFDRAGYRQADTRGGVGGA